MIAKNLDAEAMPARSDEPYSKRLVRLLEQMRRERLGSQLRTTAEDEMTELMCQLMVSAEHHLRTQAADISRVTGDALADLLRLTAGYDSTVERGVQHTENENQALLRKAREQRIADDLFTKLVVEHVKLNESDVSLKSAGLFISAESYFKLRDFATQVSHNINAVAVAASTAPAEQALEGVGTFEASQIENATDALELKLSQSRKAAEAARFKDSQKDAADIPLRGLTVGTIEKLISKVRADEQDKLFKGLLNELSQIQKSASGCSNVTEVEAGALRRSLDSAHDEAKKDCGIGALEVRRATPPFDCDAS